MQLLPAFEDFAAGFDAGANQVVWTRLVADLDTPVSLMLKLTEARKDSFLLESVTGGEVRGRYSIMGMKPDLVWECRGEAARVNRSARFDPDAFARYGEEGRNMMIDFTADWCPNCKYNERFVYESEEVRSKIAEKNVVAIRADITHNTPYTRMLERLMNQLGTRSIPFLAIFPAGEPDKPHVRYDVVTVKDIATLIDSLPEPEAAKVALKK